MCICVSDPSAFASDFSSGFLLGELLFKFGLQNDFDQFSQNKYVTQQHDEWIVVLYNGVRLRFCRLFSPDVAGPQTSKYMLFPEKKRPKCFFAISRIKLGRFWWNLVHWFLNKFAAKQCKHFPPHLNSVSTLPCETWNVHCTCATTELLQKEFPEANELWIFEHIYVKCVMLWSERRKQNWTTSVA